MKINFLPINFYIQNRSKVNTPLKPLEYDSFSKDVSFKADYQCSTTCFRVKTLKNMHCPICNKLMLNQNQIDEFVNNTYNKKGNDLIAALEKLENEKDIIGKKQGKPIPVYRKSEQEVVEIIKELAVRYPDKDIAELVKIEGSKHIKPLIESYDSIIRQAKHFIRINIVNEDDKKLILDKLDIELRRLKRKAKGNDGCAKPIIYQIVRLVKNNNLKMNFYEILSKLPSPANDCDCFFVKYSKLQKNDSKEIAGALVKSHLPTAEHINLYGVGGSNSLKNYICDCFYCNNERDFLPFHIWIESIPNLEKNLNNYLKTVQKAAYQGRIDRRYLEYIDEVIDQIDKLSYGKVKLSHPGVV